MFNKPWFYVYLAFFMGHLYNVYTGGNKTIQKLLLYTYGK